MARFVTSIFLALILVDMAAATKPAVGSDVHEPPRGIRRMIETLEKKNIGAYERAFERKERAADSPNRI
jgi:hypothetical protein